MRLCDWVDKGESSKGTIIYMDSKLNVSLLYDIATKKANVLLGCINRSIKFRS